MKPTSRKRVVTGDGVREELRRLRMTHPVGVTLGLLAEVVRDEADAEFVAGNFEADDHTRIVPGTLFNVSVGVDAIRYRPWEGA